MKDGNRTSILDQPDRERNAPDVENAGLEGPGIPSTKPIETLLAQLGPKAVFGEPVRSGETTIIPVAEVRTGFGFGGGQGRSARPTSEQTADEGGGSGAGMGARVIPRGYLRISGEQVRFEPILDIARVSMAGMALAAWIAFIISKALQR